MTLLAAVAAVAFAIALILFLAGFIRLADSAGAGPARRHEIAVGVVLIVGGVLIWSAAIGVVGGML